MASMFPRPHTPESMKNRVFLSSKCILPQTQEVFTLVTYNVLADCHAQRDNASYADPQYLKTDFRHAQTMKELAYLDGDIVCLQEVSPDFYNRTLKDWFSDFSYHYFKRTRPICDEGCATFFRKDKFECRNVELVKLKKAAEDLFETAAIEDSLLTALIDRFDVHDVAVITELRRTGTDQLVTVANTHVHYGDFVRPDIQSLEIACVKAILKKRYGASHAILCGDFNAMPDSIPYIFATTGRLSEEHWNIIKEQAKIQDDLMSVFRKAITTTDVDSQYYSAYKNVIDQEPDVTCVDNIWRCCLDYVLYREPVTVRLSSSDNTSNKDILTKSRLVPMTVLNTSSSEEMLKAVPPSHVYPSDHIPLFVKFGLEEC